MNAQVVEKDAPERKHRVATYGTLLSGFGNHRHFLADNSTFVGDCVFKGKMYSLGPYPACSIHGDTDIKAEVYEVDDHTLARLDGLEGHPNYYRREVIETSLGPAWVYLINRAEDEYGSGAEVKCGSWREYTKRER